VKGQAKRTESRYPVAQGYEGQSQEEGWDSQEETSGFASLGRAESAAWQLVFVTWHAQRMTWLQLRGAGGVWAG
jgi:hypothetical protein